MLKPATYTAAFLLVVAGPATARPSLFPPTSVVRTTCMACHGAEPGGAISRIESLRTTPEEWEHTLGRMERRYGLKLDPAMRKRALAELAATLGLTRAEATRVAYMLRSPAASDQEQLPADPQFGRVCASCHSWGKVASYRRTPESWRSLLDFHLASFPAATILSFQEIKWRLEAKEALEKIAKLLPFDASAWARDRKAKAPDLAGKYLAAGRQPGRGDYQATLILTGRGDGQYAALKEILWEDGKHETWVGAGALYGTHSLRMRFNWPRSHVKQSAQLQDGGHLDSTWAVRHYEHFFGDETLHPFRGAPRIARVAPSWMTPGGIHKLRVLATSRPGALGFGPGTRVVSSRPLPDGWHEVTVKVDRGVKPGIRSLTQSGKATGVTVAVAPRVDYIRVSPQHAVARIGYEWDPQKPAHVARQGVPFDAAGWSNGPDGKRETDDDVALGPVRGVRWELREFFTTRDDNDLDHIGTVDQAGMFMPGGFGPIEQSHSKNPTGNAWVVASWRPGPAAEAMQARAYLWVTFPDLVKEVR